MAAAAVAATAVAATAVAAITMAASFGTDFNAAVVRHDIVMS